MPEQFQPALHVVFSADSQTLFMTRRNGDIQVFSIVAGELDCRETISTQKWIRDTVIRVVVSGCGRYLVCAGSCCSIAVFKVSEGNGTWSHHLSLPKYNLAPTALAIHPNSPLLVAAFSDSKVAAPFYYDFHLIYWFFFYRFLNIIWKRCDSHARQIKVSLRIRQRMR